MTTENQRQEIPDRVYLTPDRIQAHLGQCDTVTCRRRGHGLANEAADKAYPLGFAAGVAAHIRETEVETFDYERVAEAEYETAKTREVLEETRAQVAELQKRLGMDIVLHGDYVRKTELDAANARAAGLVEALLDISATGRSQPDTPCWCTGGGGGGGHDYGCQQAQAALAVHQQADVISPRGDDRTITKYCPGWTPGIGYSTPEVGSSSRCIWCYGHDYGYQQAQAALAEHQQAKENQDA